MKTIIRITALLLALPVISSLFASCADTRQDPDGTAEPAVTDMETAAEETEGQNDGPEETFTIYENGEFSCIVVYPAEESDLISESAKAVSMALGDAAGAQYPLAMPDKMFREERYPDRCIILVGKTNVAGTEESVASSCYGLVTAELTGGKYQINIHDDRDGEAFVKWLKEKIGESPSEIVIDSSWNVSIPTGGDPARKLVKFDGGKNGSLEDEYGTVYTKTVSFVEEEDYEAYVDKCVSSGFEKVTSSEQGRFRFTVMSGSEIDILVCYSERDFSVYISASGSGHPGLALDGPEDYERDYEKWLEYSSEYCGRLDTDSVITASSGTLAWGSAHIMNALLRAYCATGDMNYLMKMAESLYGIYLLAEDNDGDGYRNWGVTDKYAPGYNEFAAHSGAVAGAAADLLNLLAGEPSLYSAVSEKYGITLGEMSDYIQKVTVEDIIPAFDRDWSERYGVYMDRLTFPEGGDPDEGTTLPHNQYLMMAYALLGMSKLDIGADRAGAYLERAESMVSTFRSFVEPQEDGTMRWNYSDLIGGNDDYVAKEDCSHGMMDMRTAIAAYGSGMVLTAEDLKAFADTYADVAAFDPAPGAMAVIPKLHDYVDGSGELKYHVFQMIYDLSVFSGKIWDMGRRFVSLAYYEDPSMSEDSLRIMAYHPGAPKPENFSLTAPEDGSGTVSCDFAVFRWEKSAHASEYVLTVARDSAFEDTVIEREGIIETNALVTDGLEAGTEYFWKVTAKTAGGKETESAASSFTTK